jgi:hypothetical protein
MLHSSPSKGGAAGSYAQSQTQDDNFIRVIEPIRRYLTRLVTERMVTPMVEWNIGEVDVMPEYFLHPLEEKDKVMICDLIIKLITAQVVHPTETWIREELDIPELDDEDLKELQEFNAPPSSPGSPTSDTKAGGLQTGGDKESRPGVLEKGTPAKNNMSPSEMAKKKDLIDSKTKFKTLLRVEPDGTKIMLINAELMKLKDPAWDWHDEGDKKQKVIQTGPYKLVRHPMYLGAIIMYIASPIALGSYWAIIPAVCIIPVLIARIKNEEEVLEKELEARGYSVITADNGNDALKLVKSKYPDLIILDIWNCVILALL